MTAPVPIPVQINMNAIPHELRQFDAWGLYTTQKLPVATKGIANGWPYHTRDAFPIYLATDDRQTWAGFDDTYRVVHSRTTRHSIHGPAFVLEESMNLVAMDLDEPSRQLEKSVLPRDRWPQFIEQANDIHRIILQWADKAGAWVEVSRSGFGRHIFAFGKLPHGRYDIRLGSISIGSIYTKKQMIFVTGHTPPRAGDPASRFEPRTMPPIEATQGLLNEFVTYFTSERILHPVADGSLESMSIGRIDTCGRRLDLSDSEVIERLAHVNKASAAALSSQNGASGDWSQDTKNIIGDLDKITGDPSQVFRILMTSKRLREAGTDKKNRSRYDKVESRFEVELAKARPWNDRLHAMRKAEEERNAEIAGPMLNNKEDEKPDDETK